MTTRTTRRRVPWIVFVALVLVTPLVTPEGGAGASTVPSPPTNLAVTAGPTTDVMTVTWGAPVSTGGSAITAYRVEIATDGGPFAAPINVAATKRKYAATCLGSTSCAFRLSAANSVGTSVPTGVVTETWDVASVVNVSTVTPGPAAGMESVKWTLPKSNGGRTISNYLYEYQLDNAGSWFGPYPVPGSTGPTPAIADLPCPSTTPGGGCGYRISSQNAIGISAPGTSKYGAYKVPAAPTLLRVVAGHNPNTAELDWQRPTSTGGLAISSYKYDVQVDAGPWTAGGTLPVSPTEAQVPCVGATISCQYRIYATNSMGSSVASAAKATSFASPSPPTALAMVVTTANAAAGTSDVSVTWSVPSNVGGLPITGYEVQFCDTFCPDPSAEWNTAPIVDVGTNTSYTTTCPAGEPTCYARVRASNAWGTSNWSNSRFLKPFAPTGLVVSNVPSQGDLFVDWNGPAEAGAGVATYQLWRCLTASGCANSANWVDTGLIIPGTQTDATHQCGPLTQCTYRARAVETGSGQVGPWSNSDSGTAPDLPTAPQNLTAATGNVIGKVDTAWQAPLDTGGYPVTGYTLQRSTDGGTTFPTTFNLGVVLSYADTACGASVICTYRVAAVTAVGQGSWSNLASAEGSNVPSAPPNLTAATGATLGYVNTAWQTPTDNGGHAITGYELQRSTDGGGTWPTSFSLGVVLNYTDTTCGASVQCTYQVRAINSMGNGAFSNTAAAYGAAVAGAPTSLTATTPTPNGSFVTPNLGKVDLSWTAPAAVNGAPAVTGYEFRYQTRTLPVGAFGLFTAWASTGTGTGTSFSPTCDASYADPIDLECRYEVRALNAIGSGASSNQAAAAALVDHVAPTVTLTNPVNGSFSNAGTVTISGTAGTAVGDATTVTVVVKTSPGGVTYQTISGIAVTAGNWTTSITTPPQGSYTFQASQVDWVPNTGSSNTNTATFDNTPPTLTITSPSAGQNLDGNTAISVTAKTSDVVPPNGVVTTRFYTASSTCSGANTAVTSSPIVADPLTFTVSDTTTRGENLTVSIQLTQTDAAGNTGTSTCVPVATRNAVWVNNATGSDTNSGLTPALAKKTVQAGITTANGGRNRVLVGADTAYTGTALTLATNGSVFGGFAVSGSTWTRPGIAAVAGSVNPTSTVFTSSTAEGAVADAKTGVTLDGLKLVSANASGAGNSSYGLRAVNGATVTLNNVHLTSGNGVAGTGGTNASANAGNGSSGGGGQGGTGNGSGNNGGGSSGAGVNGRNGSAGGAGGSQGNNSGTAGTNGIVSGGGGGNGGAAGAANGNCNDSPAGQGGGRITATTAGTAGTAGSSGAATLTGSGVAAWTAASGGNGGTGGDGHGGGGGGGGAGDGGQAAFPTCISDAGAGGGGGGGGGGAGNAGTGGTGGGGSFGLYVFNSTVTVTTATIVAGNGAAGGAGGTGFAGGTGGGGGNGGSCDTGQEYGSGGGGGGGSGGGGGGGGGGGSAGPSIAVYENGTGTVSLTGATLTKGTVGGAGSGASGGGGGGGGAAGIRGNSSQGENSNGNGCFAGQNGATGTTGGGGANGNAGSGGATFNLRSYIDGTSVS